MNLVNRPRICSFDYSTQVYSAFFFFHAIFHGIDKN